MAWGLLLASLLAFAAAGGRVALGAHRSALEIPLWVYFGAAVLTAALGVDPGRSFRFLHQDLHKVWIYTLLSVALATEAPAQALVWIGAGFAAASLIGIGQSAVYLSRHQFWFRAHAFVHPVTFGEQMAVAALGAACFLARREEDSRTPLERRAAWALLVATIAALLLSETRAAVLAFVAGLAALCWFLRGLRLPLALAAAAAGAALPLIERLRYGRFLRPEMLSAWGAATGPTISGPLQRVPLWRAAWAMGKDHLWTGVGLNNYRTDLPSYLTATFEDGSKTWGSAHNLYLQQFAERGLIGACALLLLLGAFWLRALRRAREKANVWNLWAFAAATAFLVMNVTEDALQTEMVWMLLFFVWVCAESLHRGDSPRRA